MTPMETVLLFFFLGVLAWLYRSIAEEDPDPLLLNLTLFACIGIILIPINDILSGKSIDSALFLPMIASLVLGASQALIYRHQLRITQEHLKKALTDALIDEEKTSEVEKWSYIAKEIAKVDFFPEFYKTLFNLFGGEKKGPRYEKKELVIKYLPKEIFDKNKLGITQIEVPPKKREWWWRLYFIICLTSWIIYVLAIRYYLGKS